MDENDCSTPPALRKIRPKSTLSLVDEVMNRQIGQSMNFKKKLYGSLHVVERLHHSHSLKKHRRYIVNIEFNEKGDLLISGSADRNSPIIVWDWAGRRKLKSYSIHHRSTEFLCGCLGTGIKKVGWLPLVDSSIIVTCGDDGYVKLLNAIDGTSRKLCEHFGSCNGFAIHPDTPNIVISIGADGKVLSSDVRDGETTKLVTVRGTFYVELITIDSNPRNGNEFCVGGMSESVNIYDRRKANKLLFRLCPETLKYNDDINVNCVTYNHDGTEILVSYNDDIYLFDTLTRHPYGDYAHMYEGHPNRGSYMCANYFGPKSEFIVSGSYFGTIYFWEKNTEALVQSILDWSEKWVGCVKPHPYDPVLATSGCDGTVKIWVPSDDRPPTFSELKKVRKIIYYLPYEKIIVNHMKFFYVIFVDKQI